MCLRGRALLIQRPGADQGAGDDGAAGEDAGGPPDRGVVAVCQRQPGEGLAADEPAKARFAVRYEATAKMVFSGDVPTEPPSIWPTLTAAAANPASCGATPKVPVSIAGAIHYFSVLVRPGAPGRP